MTSSKLFCQCGCAMHPYIDPDLKRDLHLLSESWETGDGPVVVYTESGGKYRVGNDGSLSGGSKGIENGKLCGSACRQGGPIRMNAIVVGMRMEIAWGKKLLLTTPVSRIERVV